MCAEMGEESWLFALYCSSRCTVLLYSLFGWVEVFRSGLKEHSDLLTLGDVDWQLNESLRGEHRSRLDEYTIQFNSIQRSFNGGRKHTFTASVKNTIKTYIQLEGVTALCKQRYVTFCPYLHVIAGVICSRRDEEGKKGKNHPFSIFSH